jgi:hypothetical protein
VIVKTNIGLYNPYIFFQLLFKIPVDVNFSMSQFSGLIPIVDLQGDQNSYNHQDDFSNGVSYILHGFAFSAGRPVIIRYIFTDSSEKGNHFL